MSRCHARPLIMSDHSKNLSVVQDVTTLQNTLKRFGLRLRFTSLCRIMTAWLKWWCSSVADVPYRSERAEPVLRHTLMLVCILWWAEVFSSEFTLDRRLNLTWLGRRCWFLCGPNHDKYSRLSKPESPSVTVSPGIQPSADKHIQITLVSEYCTSILYYWLTTSRDVHSAQLICATFSQLKLWRIYEMRRNVEQGLILAFGNVCFLLMLNITVCFTHCQHWEHALANIECVSPVMIQNHAVVLPHCQQPPTQSLQR